MRWRSWHKRRRLTDVVSSWISSSKATASCVMTSMITTMLSFRAWYDAGCLRPTTTAPTADSPSTIPLPLYWRTRGVCDGSLLSLPPFFYFSFWFLFPPLFLAYNLRQELDVIRNSYHTLGLFLPGVVSCIMFHVFAVSAVLFLSPDQQSGSHCQSAINYDLYEPAMDSETSSVWLENTSVKGRNPLGELVGN